MLRYLDEVARPGGPVDVCYWQPGGAIESQWSWLPGSAFDSPTGLVLFAEDENKRDAFSPPFPLATEGGRPLVALRDSLTTPRLLGILLLRLGYYAVGVTDGLGLVAAKSGSRYVHGRHRAGGQSQRRWERNREQWIEKLFDEACEAWQRTCGNFAEQLEGLALGGDRIVLGRFIKRCPALAPFSSRVVARRIDVERPGRPALDRAIDDIWSCLAYRTAPSP
ncbi:MAG: hypothetical protein HY682_03400 [Chloroflexi bacterium]|nr:hypothetical protein [Chloroflexota bacterium]